MRKDKGVGPKQIRLWDESIENPFLEENRRRFDISRNERLLIGLAAALVVLMVAAVLLRYDFLHKPVSAARYFSVVASRMEELWRLLTGGGSTNAADYSVYTIVIVAIVGACLAVCGAVCQSVYHTPMASPSMLGIQSGGMVAAVLFLFFCREDAEIMEYYTYAEYSDYLSSLSFYELYAQQIWMVIGCLAGALMVIAISTRAGRGKMSSVVLIISGSLFGSFAGTIVSLGQYYFTYVDTTTARTYALMAIASGTFANTYSFIHLLMLAIPALMCMGALFALSPGLNVLMFGDEEARSMGMNVRRFRTIVFVLCVIPSAVILSFCGQISFVGLVIPHFARQMAGSDHRRMLPVCALLGAVAMVLVYTAALCTGYTTSINLITSLVGGVLFLVFMLKFRRSRNADWA